MAKSPVRDLARTGEALSAQSGTGDGREYPDWLEGLFPADPGLPLFTSWEPDPRE